jgi:hypothetical protein
MKEIKLFVDFEFTSLSPDAQPISVGLLLHVFSLYSKQVICLHCEFSRCEVTNKMSNNKATAPKICSTRR